MTTAISLPSAGQLSYVDGLIKNYIKTTEWWAKPRAEAEHFFDLAEKIKNVASQSKQQCGKAIDFLKMKIATSENPYVRTANYIPCSYAITDDVKATLIEQGKVLLSKDEWIYAFYGRGYEEEVEQKSEELAEMMAESEDEGSWKRFRGIIEIAELRRQEQDETENPENHMYHGRSGDTKSNVYLSEAIEAERAEEKEPKAYAGGFYEMKWGLNPLEFDNKTGVWRATDAEVNIIGEEVEVKRGEYTVYIMAGANQKNTVNCNFGGLSLPQEIRENTELNRDQKIEAYDKWLTINNIDHELTLPLSMLKRDKDITLCCFGAPNRTHAEAVAKQLLSLV